MESVEGAFPVTDGIRAIWYDPTATRQKSILFMCNEPVLGFQVSLNSLNIEKVILSQALLIEQPRQGRPAQIEAALGRAGLIASPQTVTVEHTPRTPPNSPTEYTLYKKRGDATTRYLVYDENALGHTDGLCVYSVALRHTDWNDPLVQHLTLN